MIGLVQVDAAIELILGDDLIWSCPEDPVLATIANQLIPRDQYSPALGEPGFSMLGKAVQLYGGKVIYYRKIHNSPDSSIQL